MTRSDRWFLIGAMLTACAMGYVFGHDIGHQDAEKQSREEIANLIERYGAVHDYWLQCVEDRNL